MADQKGFWAGFWGGAKEAGFVPEVSVEPQPPAPATIARADDPEKAELRRQLAQLQTAQIQKDAQAFAEKQMSTGHAFPAETQQIVALYARCAEIDAEHLRTDGQPSCVVLLEAAYTARPANSLSRDLLAPGIKVAAVPASNSSGGDEELAQVKADAEAYAKRVNGTGRR